MKKDFAILGLLALLFSCGWADADCRTRVTFRSNYVAPTYYDPVLIAQFVPVPLYAVGYAGDGQDVAQLRYELAILKQQQDFTRELYALRAELASIRGGQPAKQVMPYEGQVKPPVPLKEPEPQPKKVSLLVQRCASCHDKSNAEANGAGRVYFENGQLTATGEDLVDMVTSMHNNTMPKAGKKLTDEEYSFGLEEIHQRAREIRKGKKGV